jgi:hypothetical protein
MSRNEIEILMKRLERRNAQHQSRPGQYFADDDDEENETALSSEVFVERLKQQSPEGCILCVLKV